MDTDMSEMFVKKSHFFTALGVVFGGIYAIQKFDHPSAGFGALVVGIFLFLEGWYYSRKESKFKKESDSS